MFHTFVPLPNANPETDKLRAQEFCGLPLYVHRDGNYYFHVIGHSNLPIILPLSAVEKAADGASRGFQIFFCLDFYVGEEQVRRWADAEELLDLETKSDSTVTVSLSDYTSLDPWEEDALMKKPTASTGGSKKARGLADQVVSLVQEQPGVPLNVIADKLGKQPNDISSLLSFLVRNETLRRERQKTDGERAAYHYYPKAA